MKWYRFSFHSNDSYAFSKNDTASRCDQCGGLLNKSNEPLNNLRITKRAMDISCTGDSVKIVSRKFMEVCEQFGLSGLRFYSLPNDPDFFTIEPTKSVRFDTERRKTKFRDLCEVCGRYRAVIGATPIYLMRGEEILADEFVRTDVEFGSGDGKSPKILCGENVEEVLSSANLRGLDLSEIERQ